MQIGDVPWTRQAMCEALEEFAEIYAKRPIKNNAGGMLSPHLFATWFAMRALEPDVIIESGIRYGQGTWFLEQACPKAKIYSIDINLARRKYYSPSAAYLDRDFALIDWTELPLDRTILFFDDHQNAYERLKTAAWFGFKRMFFEDNYPPKRGDCYSLKKALMHAGFSRESPVTGVALEAAVDPEDAPRNHLERPLERQIAPNYTDAKYLERNLHVYYEFPPVFKTESTRWGDAWEDIAYPTPTPLLTQVDREYQRCFLEEAQSYRWICYVELR